MAQRGHPPRKPKQSHFEDLRYRLEITLGPFQVSRAGVHDTVDRCAFGEPEAALERARQLVAPGGDGSQSGRRHVGKILEEGYATLNEDITKTPRARP